MLQITNTEFQELSRYIKQHCGIHLKDEKKALIMGRLQQVLTQNGFNSFSEYNKYTKSDSSGKALTELVNKITTNHTFFMREPEHFQFFRAIILPELVSKLRNKDLRLWSAGCSSGEEPYTLAMAMDKYFGNSTLNWDTKILATDISANVLRKAQKAEYDEQQLLHLPDTWRKSYFSKQANGVYKLSDDIRKEVVFRQFNLMEPFPFRRKFHVIFCRNVMIYFDDPTKEMLVRRFWDSLEHGGYLFIGHSEALNREKTQFKYVKPAIYRKE